MYKQILHTPEGVRDIYGDEKEQKTGGSVEWIKHI